MSIAIKRQEAEAALAAAEAGIAEGDAEKATKATADFKRLTGEIQSLESHDNEIKRLRGDFNKSTNAIPLTSSEIKAYNPDDDTAKLKGDYRPANWVKGLGPAIQPTWVRAQMGDNLKSEARFYQDTWQKWFRTRKSGMFFNMASANEVKAMQENADAEGGFFVPEENRTTVLHDPGAPGSIHRPYCTQLTTGLKDGYFPTMGSVTWAAIAEEAAYGDNTPVVGQVPFTVAKSGGTVKVSAELLEDSMANVPALLSQIFNEAKGRYEDTKIIAGSGSNEPEGLRTVLGASQTFTLANATSIVAADIIKAYWTLPAQYRANGMWSLTSTLMSQIETIGATAAGIHFGGNDSTVNGAMPQVDRLRGKPFVTFDGTGWDDAAAIASAEVLGAIGDFRQYYLIDRVGMSLRRDDSIYVANDQIGFFARTRFDGRVGVLNAFRLLKAA